MSRTFQRTIRDLHLYTGLFISPLIVLFAASVLFLVHPQLRNKGDASSRRRVASNVALPQGLDQLAGRARIDALVPVLKSIGVEGELGWVQHDPKQNRYVIPVTVPGRLTTVTLDGSKGEATVEERTTGLADGLVFLHKSPGPHLVGMRMNWPFMRYWLWLADSTVYLLLFLTVSGIYLWWVIRSERKMGLIFLAAGTLSLGILLYGLVS